MFNNKKILLELGSVGNHLFLEARTPIPSFSIVKFDINHLENSVKTKVIIGEQKLNANFNRKVTIYNFDISSDLFGSSLKFLSLFLECISVALSISNLEWDDYDCDHYDYYEYILQLP